MNGFNGGEQNREIASNAVFQDLGIPLIGAALGAMMAWRFDCSMDHDQALVPIRMNVKVAALMGAKRNKKFADRMDIAVGTIVEIFDPSMINPMQRKESVIFVDVDDTLIRSFGTKRIPIPSAIRYVREMFNAGHILYCWSRGGADYSREVATELGIADCFVCFLPKPDIVVDDRLEQLLDHCEFVHPNNALADDCGS